MKLRKVYIFMDESGDFGIKRIPGSSRFIVLAALVFRNGDEVKKCESKIKKLKNNLKLSEEFEFKFSKLNYSLRVKFISRLNECLYDIYYSYEDKNSFEGTISDLYSSLFENLFDKLSFSEYSLYIEIDGRMDRVKKKESVSFLRKIICGHKVKIIFTNSKNSILIQCADIVAGSIRINYESSNHEFFDMLKKHIVDIKREKPA